MEPDRVKMGLKSFSKCKNSSPQELSFVIAWLGFNEAENQWLNPWQGPLFGLLCLLHLKKYSLTIFDMGWQDCKDEEILFPVENWAILNQFCGTQTNSIDQKNLVSH